MSDAYYNPEGTWLHCPRCRHRLMHCTEARTRRGECVLCSTCLTAVRIPSEDRMEKLGALAIPREILDMVDQLGRGDGWETRNARAHLEAIREFIGLALGAA